MGRDAKSRVYCAIPVPQKGVDSDEYAVKSCLCFLDFLGYIKMMLKTNQEPALGAVMKKLCVRRGSDTQTMRENSAVRNSKQNDFIERAIQQVEGQIHTLRDALQENIGKKLRTDDRIVPWM